MLKLLSIEFYCKKTQMSKAITAKLNIVAK